MTECLVALSSTVKIQCLNVLYLHISDDAGAGYAA